MGLVDLQSNEEAGCRFLKWIDPPSTKNELDFVRRLEEVEEKVKILCKVVQRRDEEISRLTKFRKVFTFVLLVFVSLIVMLLFLYMTA